MPCNAVLLAHLIKAAHSDVLPSSNTLPGNGGHANTDTAGSAVASSCADIHLPSLNSVIRAREETLGAVAECEGADALVGGSCSVGER